LSLLPLLLALLKEKKTLVNGKRRFSAVFRIRTVFIDSRSGSESGSSFRLNTDPDPDPKL
jgi:hypothetical protein